MRPEEIEMRRRLGVPAGALKVDSKEGAATAYVYTDGLGRPCARLFYGRAWRPAWKHWFSSEAQRERMIRQGFEAAAQQAQRLAERKAERQTQGRGLAVGDVLSACWGYEQTNYDFYQVTALIGATMVEIRELAQAAEETQWLQGKCVPLVDQFAGDPLRRKAVNGRVKVDDVRTAHKLEPLALVGGKAIYPASHYTAYH